MLFTRRRRMSYARLLCVGLIAALLSLGCTTEPKKDGGKKDDHDNKHEKHEKGPHKGDIVDFGKYHAELVFERDKKSVTVYILGSDEKTATAVKAEDLTIKT